MQSEAWAVVRGSNPEHGDNGRDDYGCYIHDEDGGAPLMWSEGTALPRVR